MADRWWRSESWDDTGDDDASDDATHRCRVCDHGARISTPQRRTEHYCRECDTWQRFESVVNGRA